MYPLLFGTIPAYLFMWGVAAVVCIPGGTWLAARRGLPTRRSAIAIAVFAVTILVGSKLLYIFESVVSPLSDYVPPEARGSLHGFRIPGGILAVLAALPVVCGSLGLRWREFGDTEAPVSALFLVLIRLGCLLNGCCFGRVSDVPWATTFPPGTWAFWYQDAHHWLGPDATTSLPVHPLQLYFVGAAVLTLGVLLLLRRFPLPPGRLILVFSALFFGTTAMIEPFRANRLILNEWIVTLAAVVSAGILLARRSHEFTYAPLASGGDYASRNERRGSRCPGREIP